MMTEEDEEELLLLRIQALKSSKENQIADDSNVECKDKKSLDDEETTLRNMALNSLQSAKKVDSKDSNIGDEKTTSDNQIKQSDTPQPEVSTADRNVEELFLREKALKTLLQKRVVKTQKMIEEAIQNEKVSSTSNLSKKSSEENKTKTLETESPEPSVKKKAYLNPNLLKSTELRNFLSIIPRDKEEEEEEENSEKEENEDEGESQGSCERLDSVQIDSDDELSICASDDEESTVSKKPVIDTPPTEKPLSAIEIQCNIVSSCCEKEGNNTRNETNDLDEVVPNQNIEESLELVTRDSEILDDEKPGPSGYLKPNENIDSDSDTSSIIEIKPPDQKQSRVLNLISDSDSDVAITSGKGKQKKKKKKQSVKDQLSKQEGIFSGDREDFKDLTCSVCLGPFENRTFLKECFHSFCQICIMQWAELSRTCPLCKTYYTTLIHSVTDDLQFEEYVFPKKQSTQEKKQHQNQFSEVMNDGRRFRYSSTVIDHETWTQRRQQREKAENERALGRDQRRINRRLRWSATKDRRKAVYNLKMVIKEVKQRGKTLVRDISPKFFQDNPAIKHRLVPWLLRDLNVLLGNDDEMIRFVMSLILNVIPKVAMDSEEFKKQLVGFLYDKTNQFVNELVSFARSPYDIRGYDSNVVYDIPSTIIESDKEDEENVEKKILHEVFLAGQQHEPILSKSSKNTIDSDVSGNSEDLTPIDEQEPQHREPNGGHQKEIKSELLTSGEHAEMSMTSPPKDSIGKECIDDRPKYVTEAEPPQQYIKKLNGCDDVDDDDEVEHKSKKQKTKKKKKKKDLKEKERHKDDMKSRSEESEDKINVHSKKRKRKRKHKKKHHNSFENESESESNSKKSDLKNHRDLRGSEEKEMPMNSKTEDLNPFTNGIENENSIPRGNDRRPLSEDVETAIDTKKKKRKRKRPLSADDENSNTSRHRFKNKKKRKKRTKSKKSRDTDDVTHRLYKFLGSETCPSSRQEQNISLLNEQLQKYVETHNEDLLKDKTLKTQSEIITELLAVEKALLRSQRKKEITRIKERQAELEETRSKRRRAGDADYNENDEEIYRIDDELEGLFRQMEKS